MPDYETLLYRETDGVAWVTMNRPEVHNAFNFTMQDELKDVWQPARRTQALDAGRVLIRLGSDPKSLVEGQDRFAAGERIQPRVR